MRRKAEHRETVTDIDQHRASKEIWEGRPQLKLEQGRKLLDLPNGFFGISEDVERGIPSCVGEQVS